MDVPSFLFHPVVGVIYANFLMMWMTGSSFKRQSDPKTHQPDRQQQKQELVVDIP
jgi:hypothetical protein